MLAYSDNMSFIERWYNTLVTIVDAFVRNWIHLPSEERFAQKYFAHLAPLPPLKEILQNISLNLVNTHRAISLPRPTMPSNKFLSIFVRFVPDSKLFDYDFLSSL